MIRLERMILELPPFRAVSKWAGRTVLPGFAGLSLLEVSRFFFKEIRNVKLNERCAASTYNFMMAIPPSLLFLFSLLPYFPLSGVETTIKETLDVIPLSSEVRLSINSFIENFIHKERRDILSFGVLMVLFFSSNGMMGLMRSFDKGMHVYKVRSGFQRRWTSIKLTVMLIAVAIMAIATSIIQSRFINKYIEMVFDNVIVLKIVSMMLIVLVLFCAISIIYRYGPSLTNKFKFISVGSVFATLTIGITTTVFFFMVDNFLNYNKVYGSIGTLIAFMIWLYLIVMIILIGYELNVSILIVSKAKREKELKTKTL